MMEKFWQKKWETKESSVGQENKGWRNRYCQLCCVVSCSEPQTTLSLPPQGWKSHCAPSCSSFNREGDSTVTHLLLLHPRELPGVSALLGMKQEGGIACLVSPLPPAHRAIVHNEKPKGQGQILCIL